MTNMVEKVARAILRSEGEEEEVIDKIWEGTVPEAKAAIEALREPTDDLVNEFSSVYMMSIADCLRLTVDIILNNYEENLCPICDNEAYDPGSKCSCCGLTPEIKDKSKESKESEEDPYGLDQHSPGAKLDKGKPRVALMFKSFPRALMEVAKVSTYGADKYSDMGWQHAENGIDRYDDAAGRHLLQKYMEDYDEESGMRHSAQQIWNALANLELVLREEENK